ncbi:MAG: GNAT family N-acetyltransferase, partial [Anaerolineales bacterium]|nr:GNAT family N-acetyltransferase [Anaerolineales bacterium]
RPLAEADLDAVYDLWLQPDVWGPAGELPSLELLAAKEKVAAASPTLHRLVAEADGQLLGIGTLQHNSRNPRRAHSGDLTILVHPAYRRQGVGTQLGQALLGIADDWLNLQRVSGQALAADGASLALAARLGLQSVSTSKRGQFGYGHWQAVVSLNRLHGVPESTSYPQASNVSPPPRRALSGPITIEPFDPAQIPALHRCFSHPLVANTTAQIPSLEFNTLAARLTPHQPGLYRLVALHEGEAIGMCSIYQWDLARRAHSAGLGMMVYPTYWGYGVGSQLMAAILELADNWLGLKRVDLEVTTDNPAGIALYQKFGFQLDGAIPYYLYGGGRWAHVHAMSRWHDGHAES